MQVDFGRLQEKRASARFFFDKKLKNYVVITQMHCSQDLQRRYAKIQNNRSGRNLAPNKSSTKAIDQKISK
jgi:hypothetical protein